MSQPTMDHANSPSRASNPDPATNPNPVQAFSGKWENQFEQDSFLRRMIRAMGWNTFPLDYKEMTELRYNLEARKAIEQAKARLMGLGKTEGEAYREILIRAREHRIPMRLAANDLLGKPAD